MTGEQGADEDDDRRVGTVGLWFWGSLLAFGAFLVAVPGRDDRARIWLVTGLVLVVLAGVGLARSVRARSRRVGQDGEP